jgi:hypothetical protein
MLYITRLRTSYAMEQIGDLPPSDSLPQIADVAFDETR